MSYVVVFVVVVFFFSSIVIVVDAIAVVLVTIDDSSLDATDRSMFFSSATDGGGNYSKSMMITTTTETMSRRRTTAYYDVGGGDRDDEDDDGRRRRIRRRRGGGTSVRSSSGSSSRRRLRAMPVGKADDVVVVVPSTNGAVDDGAGGERRGEEENATVMVGGVRINALRRAKDVVSNADVPFLLQLPYADHDVLYDIMTECYGLTPRVYETIDELIRAREVNALDNDYVSYHDVEHNVAHQRDRGGRLFHFLATPYYREGVDLLTQMHRGRMIVMMSHPVYVAEGMYLSSRQPQRAFGGGRTMDAITPEAGGGYDVRDLVKHVNSTDYYDNYMTRMLANIPPDIEVTDEHFRDARMILENKFLIGMSYDLIETVKRRLGLYFGWRELPNKVGCESERIMGGSSSRRRHVIIEKSPEWRFIARRNRYDVKLYARAMAVFGDQKMRVPIHPIIRAEEKAIVEDAFFYPKGHMRDISEPREDTDLPFFWHIPKASGTTVKETLSECYGLIRTEMIRPPSSFDVIHNRKVLNVDLSTPDAVANARRNGLVDRELADVIVSQLGLEGSTIFTNRHMGRAFTILRHPVRLAVSLFYYRRIATWEPTYSPELNDITLREYVERDGYYDNWMVRMLANAKLGGLNDGHLDLARSILERKFVVGISDHMDESFRQFEMYFGWKEKKAGCVTFHLHSAPSNKNKYPDLEHGGEVWNVIADKNKYDMALYYYALELFGKQSEKMSRVEKAID
ncbi:hypothetical protein ACHAXA_010820 [Cyclostephanos tholiformis]|uniref:Uncharacterized protein n=1 Tax=Cyclostephanos tholiformis TaxID=382380 RepID=A0ABD3SGS3_9STRA